MKSKLAARLWNLLPLREAHEYDGYGNVRVKSLNFYALPSTTQRDFEQALDTFLKEYHENLVTNSV